MKFTIQKSYFLEGLNHVSRVIAPHSILEILKGIKLELTDNKLILKASDSLVSVEYAINQYIDDKEIITIEDEGQVVLPSRNFIEIIRKAPTDFIEIEKVSNNILVYSGNSEFNIKGYDPEEYPEFPVISKDNSFKLDTKIFNDVIRETVFCTAPNDQRPILEGVNLSLRNKILTATATDSYRLSRRVVILNEENSEKEFNLIIPRKALQYFQKMIENGQGEVEIFYENNRIVLYYQNVVYTVLLISGNYPNTDKLIPTNFECTLVSNSREFFNAVDRVSLMSREDKDDIIKLIVSENSLEISSQSKELGSAVEEMNVKSMLEDDKFEISVSGKYLKDAVNAIASEEIIIKFSGELTAFIVQPSDYHRDIIELILPVRTY
ncbi:DNA polymerase III, beta subunit [Gemella bergeri ATCC 700627]|uniref:Beta sliding clamp n=1 Tax=Gemella bergeri ATCC 700627 TaxID=1321820 RepID=U2S990_9BACL|nr:DNA polymerase III subunit beta [Gemella bergeri]ERK59367.1 DNA polymerase III, beta subunit [Gemella bergeri ATCC 700627]